jgi:CheY-like chemotaxis protein
MLGTLLTVEGYAVITAFNGGEAMTMVQRHAPRVILLDLEMPVMDGFGFRAAQRRLASPLCDIAVVIVSGVNDANQLKDGLSAAAVMPKPVDAATLLTVVRALAI